jgi:hypothetical protein
MLLLCSFFRASAYLSACRAPGMACRFRTNGVVAVRTPHDVGAVGLDHGAGPPGGVTKLPVSEWLLSAFVMPSFAASLVDDALTCHLQSLVRFVAHTQGRSDGGICTA